MGAALSSFKEGIEWQSALSLVGTMAQAVVQADTISCNSAIAACECGWKWRIALRLLGIMHVSQLTRNFITYSATASACEDGNWRKAMEVLRVALFELSSCNGIHPQVSLIE